MPLCKQTISRKDLPLILVLFFVRFSVLKLFSAWDCMNEHDEGLIQIIRGFVYPKFDSALPNPSPWQHMHIRFTIFVARKLTNYVKYV